MDQASLGTLGACRVYLLKPTSALARSLEGLILEDDLILPVLPTEGDGPVTEIESALLEPLLPLLLALCFLLTSSTLMRLSRLSRSSSPLGCVAFKRVRSKF